MIDPRSPSRWFVATLVAAAAFTLPLSCGGNLSTSTFGVTDAAPAVDAGPDGAETDAARPDANDATSSDAPTDALEAQAPLVLDPTPCLGGGSVAYWDPGGSGPGSQPATLSSPGWLFDVFVDPVAAPASIEVDVTPPSTNPVSTSLSVHVAGPSGEAGQDGPLAIGATYAGAVSYSTGGQAQLAIAYDGDAPCQSGSFVVSALAVTTAEVGQLTIAFACDQGSSHGCVHLENVPRQP